MGYRRGGLGDQVDATEPDFMASVSDLMAALIFTFIITLMIYVARFHATTSSLESAGKTREEMLRQMAASFEKKGLEVEINVEQGILRMNENWIGFRRNSPIPLPEHEKNILVLASVLQEVLPCFVKNPGIVCPNPPNRDVYGGYVDVALVEGHTDAVPVRSKGGYDNIDLSGDRAAHVWKMVNGYAPRLRHLKNYSHEPVFSIAGYGPQRLALADAPHSSANRRIDVRFIMEQPRLEHRKQEVVVETESRLEQ